MNLDLTPEQQALIRAGLEMAAKYCEKKSDDIDDWLRVGVADAASEPLPECLRYTANEIRRLSPPADHVLVPREPTDAMCKAGYEAPAPADDRADNERERNRFAVAHIYRAMIKGE